MTVPPPPVAFAGSPLDRADHLRSDPQALAARMDWRARLLLLDGLLPRLDDRGALQWGTLADAEPDDELVFLGELDGKACFAPVPQPGEPGGPSNPRAWQVMGLLQPGDLALYGGARSLVDWHARHRFCSQCGQPTTLAKGGWQRDCPSCGASHFPRVDPVTIMLVEHEDRLLLGRQPRFPPRQYSALAGFVEPGETIEEAVQREVMEEAGLAVRDVSYIASQPWPFPSQLMLGCYCIADDNALTVDETELDDARWFTRDEVRQSLDSATGDGPFKAPPPVAIAHTLLRWWLDSEA